MTTNHECRIRNCTEPENPQTRTAYDIRKQRRGLCDYHSTAAVVTAGPQGWASL